MQTRNNDDIHFEHVQLHRKALFFADILAGLILRDGRILEEDGHVS